MDPARGVGANAANAPPYPTFSASHILISD
jgi:hypothetical protein